MLAETDIVPILTSTTIEAVLSENSCDGAHRQEGFEASDTLACALCLKTFVDHNHLKKHYEEHKPEKPFKCGECTEEFNVEANLRLHKAWLHSLNDGKLECPECGKTFARKASLRSHLLLHQKDESIRCMDCDDEFASYTSYKNHVNICPKSLATEAAENNKRWSCSQCKQYFATSSLLRNHTKLHFQIKCSLKQRFQRKEVDRTGFVHVCEFCSKRFKKKSQLIRHIRVHTGEKPFVCEVCGKSFTQKNSLEIHKSKHTGEKKHKCKFCDATFTQPGNMRSHIDRVHAPQALLPADQLFNCPFCSCVFRKIGSLNCHVSRRHVTDGDSIVSNTNDVSKNCESKRRRNINSTNKQDLLRKAMENSGMTYCPSPQNADGVKTLVPLTDSVTGVRQSHVVRRIGRLSFHQCLYCPKEFKKSSDLVRHIRIHTHERPFKCDQCYRSFTVKSTLQVHLKTHSDLKEFICGICDKRFISYQSLKVHKRIHVTTTSFSCAVCEKHFATSTRLQSHLKTHQTSSSNNSLEQNSSIESSLFESIELQQPIRLDTETQDNVNTEISLLNLPSNLKVDKKYKNTEKEKRNFSCTHCNKAFKKSSHLKQHIRSHTGEKPYQCSVCSQVFVSNGSLKAHLRTHSGEKPFTCVQCSFQFTTKGSLTRHMTTHSSNRPFMCPYCHKTFKASLNCKKHIKVHKTEIVVEILKRRKDVMEKNGANSDSHTAGNFDSQTLPIENSPSAEMQPINNLSPANDCVLTSMCENMGYIAVIDANTENSVCVPINSVFQMTPLDFNNASNEALDGQKLCPPLISSCEVRANKHQSTSKSLIKPISETLPTKSDLLNPSSMNKSEFKIVAAPERSALTSIIDATEADKGDTQKESHKVTRDATVKNTSLMELKKKKSNECRSCEYCSKTFKKRSDLVRHTRIHTGEKPFVCKLCNKQFTVKSTLDSHILTHKGERNFKCFVCNSLFATKGSLNVHTRLHTGDRPFKCSVCNLSFRTSGHLKSHSLKHDKLKNCITKNNIAADCCADSANVVIVEQNSNDISQLNDTSVVPFLLSSSDDFVDSLISQQPTLQIDSSNLLASLNIQIDSNLIQQLQQNGLILASTAKD